MAYIGVFCGGFSSEYDISVKSAKNIKKNIPSDYIGVLVFVNREEWFVEISGKKTPFNKNDCSFIINGNKKNLHAAIVYVHGDPGENGKIQAFLEINNVPYINSGPLASALSFDKWFCNEFLRGFNIPVAKAVLIKKGEDYDIKQIIRRLNLPLFVKPTDSGSSYGISKVLKEKDLDQAINNAFKEGKTVLLESFLDGKEITCAVYKGKKGLTTLPLTEIYTENDFFDFDAKYNGNSKEITPARITKEEKKKTEELSKKIYSLLQLRSISRIDYMLVNNEPIVIEVNTTPGFSNESIIPKMLKTKGLTQADFWKEIFSVELKKD